MLKLQVMKADPVVYWTCIKLDLKTNTTVLYKKAQSRLYFIKSLRSFEHLLQMSYKSVVATVIMYAVVCCGSNIKVVDIIRRVGFVLGVN